MECTASRVIFLCGPLKWSYNILCTITCQHLREKLRSGWWQQEIALNRQQSRVEGSGPAWCKRLIGNLWHYCRQLRHRHHHRRWQDMGVTGSRGVKAAWGNRYRCGPMLQHWRRSCSWHCSECPGATSGQNAREIQTVPAAQGLPSWATAAPTRAALHPPWDCFVIRVFAGIVGGRGICFGPSPENSG